MINLRNLNWMKKGGNNQLTRLLLGICCGRWVGQTFAVVRRVNNLCYGKELGIEDCFTLNCTLKYCRISQERKRTLRVKNCLYFDVELFLELMTKFGWTYCQTYYTPQKEQILNFGRSGRYFYHRSDNCIIIARKCRSEE